MKTSHHKKPVKHGEVDYFPVAACMQRLAGLLSEADVYIVLPDVIYNFNFLSSVTSIQRP